MTADVNIRCRVEREGLGYRAVLVVHGRNGRFYTAQTYTGAFRMSVEEANDDARQLVVEAERRLAATGARPADGRRWFDPSEAS